MVRPNNQAIKLSSNLPTILLTKRACLYETISATDNQGNLCPILQVCPNTAFYYQFSIDRSVAFCANAAGTGPGNGR
jgi:hypothetical protein